MPLLLKTVYDHKVTPIGSYLSSDRRKSSEMSLRWQLNDLYKTTDIYSGKGFVSRVNLFMTSLSNEKSVIHSAKVFEIKVLADALTKSGKLSAVHLTYNGRIKGDDRKGVVTYRYDNPRVPVVDTHTYRMVFSRSKYGTIGGTMLVKAPFPLSLNIRS